MALWVSAQAVSGCTTSTSSGTAAGSGENNTTVASVSNFGDSITCGYYASPNDGSGNVYSTAGYAGLLDAAIAKPAQNLCRVGDQAADMARLWVYPNAVPTLGAGQLFTVMIGTNDVNFCGVSSGCQTNYTSSLLASLAWLGLPASDKTLASAMQQQGTWVADDAFAFGRDATGPGASLNLTVQQAVAGRLMYVGYRVADQPESTAGSAVVMVDGVATATLNGSSSTGTAILTNNGTTDTIFAAVVPLGAVGAHTVSITTTSEASAAFTVLWAGVSSGNYATTASAPRVLVGGVPAGSAGTMPTNVPIYNTWITTMVSGLAAEGMAISMAPTATALDTSSDLTADGVHPNNSGHAKLAAAFESALN